MNSSAVTLPPLEKLQLDHKREEKIYEEEANTWKNTAKTIAFLSYPVIALFVAQFVLMPSSTISAFVIYIPAIILSDRNLFNKTIRKIELDQCKKSIHIFNTLQPLLKCKFATPGENLNYFENGLFTTFSMGLIKNCLSSIKNCLNSIKRDSLLHSDNQLQNDIQKIISEIEEIFTSKFSLQEKINKVNEKLSNSEVILNNAIDRFYKNSSLLGATNFNFAKQEINFLLTSQKIGNILAALSYGIIAATSAIFLAQKRWSTSAPYTPLTFLFLMIMGIKEAFTSAYQFRAYLYAKKTVNELISIAKKLPTNADEINTTEGASKAFKCFKRRKQFFSELEKTLKIQTIFTAKIDQIKNVQENHPDFISHVREFIQIFRTHESTISRNLVKTCGFYWQFGEFAIQILKPYRF